MKETIKVLLAVDSLIQTNPILDKKYVDYLTQGIKSGEILKEELEPLFVRVIPNEGYFVSDGNHSHASFKQAGVKEVFADVYSLE